MTNLPSENDGFWLELDHLKILYIQPNTKILKYDVTVCGLESLIHIYMEKTMIYRYPIKVDGRYISLLCIFVCLCISIWKNYDKVVSN